MEGEGELEGGGFSGEGEEAVAGGVLVEVDEEVDLVEADFVGELGVGEICRVVEVVGEGLEVGGDGVGRFRVGVEEGFDLRFVVELEDGEEEEANGVGAEFGGDIGDAEDFFGGLFVGVVVRNGVEGFGVAAGEFFVFVEEGFHFQGGVEEKGVEEGAVDVGAFGGEGEGAAEVGEGFVVFGLIEEEGAEVGLQLGA